MLLRLPYLGRQNTFHLTRYKMISDRFSKIESHIAVSTHFRVLIKWLKCPGLAWVSLVYLGTGGIGGD